MTSRCSRELAGWVPLPPFSSSLCLSQELREPPQGSFDTLTPTLARPPGTRALGGSEVELAQLRLFTFSSELQRMSVIVSSPIPMSSGFHSPIPQVRVAPTSEPKQLHVFCKGAPETVCQLCSPESGFPPPPLSPSSPPPLILCLSFSSRGFLGCAGIADSAGVPGAGSGSPSAAPGLAQGREGEEVCGSPSLSASFTCSSQGGGGV